MSAAEVEAAREMPQEKVLNRPPGGKDASKRMVSAVLLDCE